MISTVLYIWSSSEIGSFGLNVDPGASALVVFHSCSCHCGLKCVINWIKFVRGTYVSNVDRLIEEEE